MSRVFYDYLGLGVFDDWGKKIFRRLKFGINVVGGVGNIFRL